MSETTTGKRFPKARKWVPLVKFKPRKPEARGSGLQELWPGTALQELDPVVVVSDLLQQAQERGINLMTFTQTAGPFCKPWKQGRLPEEWDSLLLAFGRKAGFSRKDSAVLWLSLLLVLNYAHELRFNVIRALETGNHVRLRRCLKSIVTGEAIDRFSEFEFIQEY